MGGRDRGKRSKGDRRRRVDGFAITFAWADDATGEPEQEVTLSGEEWDRVIAFCQQLTRRGAEVLAGLEIEHIRLADLTPEKMDGRKLFVDNAELISWCNERGKER